MTSPKYSPWLCLHVRWLSLFDEDPEAWLELLISLPPIDLEECFAKQREAKLRLIEKRDLSHLKRYIELREAGDPCNYLAENELRMLMKTAAPLPRPRRSKRDHTDWWLGKSCKNH